MKQLVDFHFGKEFSVGSFQVRPDGKLRMNYLADFFDIKAANLPTWGESIKVFTAGRGVDKLFAFREFLITDLQGKSLARAMSSWVLLNTVSKKIHRPEQVLPTALFDPQLKPDWQPDRIRISGKLLFEEEVKVRFSDLDLNNHVNNTTYIRWVEDLFKDHQIDSSQLLINYSAECVLGDQVKLELYKSEDKFQIQGKVLNKSVFLAETEV
jgi:medium-chain acyl-[acyl-carrier-protein] hydrolase